MCLSSVGGGYLDVGVMLEIRETKERADGNILVDCVGSRRFRILKRSTLVRPIQKNNIKYIIVKKKK